MDKIEVKKRADDLGTFQWPLMGYAPGYYMRPCLDCKAVMTHCDKRATQCLSCALTSILATRTDATPVAWMPMTSSPADEPILAAIKVRHADGQTRWERHIIVIDSETGTISNMDFHHGWEVQEYTFWQPLPAAPDASYTHPPATDVAALVDHFRRMMEACANYVEPTTYIARHPVGELCKWNTEFPEPRKHQSIDGALATTRRRDQAFISDMIYMLDGPEQRAALAPFTKGQP